MSLSRFAGSCVGVFCLVTQAVSQEAESVPVPSPRPQDGVLQESLSAARCFQLHSNNPYGLLPLNFDLQETAATIGCLLELQDEGHTVDRAMYVAVVDLQDTLMDYSSLASIQFRNNVMDGALGPNTASDTLQMITKSGPVFIMNPEYFYQEGDQIIPYLQRFASQLQALAPNDYAVAEAEAQKTYEAIGEMLRRLYNIPSEDEPELPACEDVRHQRDIPCTFDA